jgi:hypothetical protein
MKTQSREMKLWGIQIGSGKDPLISVTGEREWPPSRYLDRLKEVAILQATGFAKFPIYR